MAPITPRWGSAPNAGPFCLSMELMGFSRLQGCEPASFASTAWKMSTPNLTLRCREEVRNLRKPIRRQSLRLSAKVVN